MRALVAVAAAMLVLATASAVPGSGGPHAASPSEEARDCCPLVSPDGTSIIFVRHLIGGAPSELVAMEADGTSETVLARGVLTATVEKLTWSPDETRLAFVSNYRLYTMRPDGTGWKRLAPGYEYAWSPDGTMLAVNAEHFGGPVTVYSAAGRQLRTFTRGADSAPAWSPDGRWIASIRSFGRKGEGGSALYVVRPGGGQPRLLAEGAARPSWMPDGRIAFVAKRGDVYAATTTGELRRLFRLPAAELHSPSPLIWSSDGARVVAERSLLAASGRLLWQLPRSAANVSPSGDATFLAFDSFGDCVNTGIWTADVPRKRVRRLTQICRRLDGTERGDVLAGSARADRIRALGGDDVVRAGSGNDVVHGGDGDDLLDGGRGADRLYGDDGHDRFVGGAGNDVIVSRDGRSEVVDCGAGYEDGAQADATDRLTSCEFNAVRRP